MPRYLLYLRIAASVVCLIPCLLLIGLWVRSNRFCETTTRIDSNHQATVLGWDGGSLYLIKAPSKDILRPNGTLLDTHSHGWRLEGGFPVTKEPARFRWSFSNGITMIYFPFWLLVPIAAVLVALPWIRWHFSLRTLLIAMTLMAVVLMLVVWAAK
jgi:hypothetical protein